MKTGSISIRIVVVLISLLLCGVCQGKRQGGLLGVFSGKDDPTKDRLPKVDEGTTGDTKTKKPADTTKTGPIYSPPDPQRLDKRIEYLKGLKYDKLKHAPELEQARQRINYLRRQAERLRFSNDKHTAMVAKKLGDHKKRMEDRWLKLAGALKDGKKRTSQEWAELARSVFGEPEQPDLPDEDAAKAADDVIGIPTPEELESEEDEPAATEDQVDPLKPVKAPETKIDTTPPKLEDLAEAIKGQAKPETMHPLTWARLLGRFGQDLAEFQVAYTQAMKELQEKRSREYDPLIAALKAAQETYSNLKKLGYEPGEALRRHLAYRIYQAELAQLELEREDLRQIEKERQGEKTDRSMSIRTNPMAPEETLMDLARMMDVSGNGPPSPDQFDNLDAGGLPGLYPPGSDTIIDEHVQYGNLVKANIARYQRKLRDVHDRMANAEQLVREREYKVLRREASKLRKKDRLQGKEGHPLNEAYNRRTLKKIQQELTASRQKHIEQLKSKLEAEAQGITKRLEIEYKRRDAILEAEKPTLKIE